MLQRDGKCKAKATLSNPKLMHKHFCQSDSGTSRSCLVWTAATITGLRPVCTPVTKEQHQSKRRLGTGAGVRERPVAAGVCRQPRREPGENQRPSKAQFCR